ncbi:Signal-transduction histidine kinase senX3 [Parvicella tangerina]|uniref:histidine kinase n=2 Tax=Parvicella tangerina TaxID=2829795 RepID=A0A916NKF7_9FLAO|nr:Signal-transduction histidine kinase senX3 [Parvicella tangerina]
MTTNGKSKKTLLVFYLLIGYILAQISWWIFQIISLSKQIDDSGGFAKAKMRMLAGEFAVFFVLLCIGLFYIHRVFRKELELSTNKKNFSLSITHELKTPITTSKLFLESLINHDNEISQAKRMEIYEKVYAEQSRLNELIEKVLLSARMENAQIKLELESTAVAEEIKGIVAKMNLEQTMVLDLQEDVQVKVDRFYFRSIIQNLIENASKYSPNDSKIELKLNRKGKFATIAVVDEGVGLSSEEKSQVFEMYQRLENEEVKESKGTGLGLYIVKQLIKGHKGKITVEDNPQGKGSVFTVYFPIT